MKLAILATLLAGQPWAQVQIYEIFPNSPVVLCMVGNVAAIDVTSEQVILTLDSGFISDEMGRFDPYRGTSAPLRIVPSIKADEVEAYRIGSTRIALVTRFSGFIQVATLFHADDDDRQDHVPPDFVLERIDIATLMKG